MIAMPASPPPRRTAASVPACALAFALSACAHPSAPPAPSSAHEESVMSPHAQAAKPLSPRLDAEHSLQKLLDLLRAAHRIEDIDGAALKRAFGVDFASHDGRLGFGEQITAEWWSSIELDPKPPYGPRLEFAFRPADPNGYPSATDLCALDFDRFAGELVAAGFQRETYRGEHDRVIHDTFTRDALKVTVETRGENDDSPEKIAHACVKTVFAE
jgi:hypothetical protein